MKTGIAIALAACIALTAGCNEDDGKKTLTVTSTFDDGMDAWTGDFADYPVGEEAFYELQTAHATLPAPLSSSEGAIRQSGNNHSDDLFMFIRKKITGLSPNTAYRLTFEVEFASNVADGMVGIGGSPGESVYIKAGASAVEPVKQEDGSGSYQMNIDKGNQSQGGTAMTVIGDFSNDTDSEVYTLVTRKNTQPFTATTDASGQLWVIVGTDSGFEGTTTIYYNRIEISFQ